MNVEGEGEGGIDEGIMHRGQGGRRAIEKHEREAWHEQGCPQEGRAVRQTVCMDVVFNGGEERRGENKGRRGEERGQRSGEETKGEERPKRGDGRTIHPAP